jgi:2-(1,2-epoxy-1,2-dihydrophenyl)acetyl-CoA isomerase
MPEALAMARRMTGFSPLVLPAIKANLNDSEHLGLSGLMDREAERHIRLGLTDDAREAAHAFLAKRSPVFKGR